LPDEGDKELIEDFDKETLGKRPSAEGQIILKPLRGTTYLLLGKTLFGCISL
jgi:hypothetical protein